MSLVEDGAPQAQAILRGLAPHIGRAHCVGFTGPPGVGKSSLLAVLSQLVRREGRSVGIVAADPTSAFTGGALLGDRIRMQRLFSDPGVFIRSVATRAHPGSLPPAARDLCRILDAMGKDLVFLETVGAGQSDTRVLRHVDTVVLVLSPGTGDFIQAMKAGWMEVADIIVLNKADLPGSEQALADLRTFLQTRVRVGAATMRDAGRRGETESRESPADAWEVPVLPTSTVAGGEGIEALVEAVCGHARHLRATGELEVRRRLRLREEIAEHCSEHLAAGVLTGDRLEEYVEEVVAGRLAPAEAGERLAADILRHRRPASR